MKLPIHFSSNFFLQNLSFMFNNFLFEKNQIIGIFSVSAVNTYYLVIYNEYKVKRQRRKIIEILLTFFLSD